MLVYLVGIRDMWKCFEGSYRLEKRYINALIPWNHNIKVENTVICKLSDISTHWLALIASQSTLTLTDMADVHACVVYIWSYALLVSWPQLQGMSMWLFAAGLLLWSELCVYTCVWIDDRDIIHHDAQSVQALIDPIDPWEECVFSSTQIRGQCQPQTAGINSHSKAIPSVNICWRVFFPNNNVCCWWGS